MPTYWEFERISREYGANVFPSRIRWAVGMLDLSVDMILQNLPLTLDGRIPDQQFSLIQVIPAVTKYPKFWYTRSVRIAVRKIFRSGLWSLGVSLHTGTPRRRAGIE